MKQTQIKQLEDAISRAQQYRATQWVSIHFHSSENNKIRVRAATTKYNYQSSDIGNTHIYDSIIDERVERYKDDITTEDKTNQLNKTTETNETNKDSEP